MKVFKKRISILAVLFIVMLSILTGCVSEKERDEWKVQQMDKIPEIKTDLENIAQVVSDHEVSGRWGTHYYRNVFVLLKFKIGTMEVDKNFTPTDVQVSKNLKQDERPYVSLKFVDMDMVSKDGYSIERGIYDIVVHLPSEYIVREIDNRKYADK